MTTSPFNYDDYLSPYEDNLKHGLIKYDYFPETYLGSIGETNEIKVFIKVQVNDKKVETHITDAGFGLSSKELKRIFRRFYRVPNLSTEKAKGTGLGLYIVRAIIKKHKGKIWAESNGEGKGSTFIVQLRKIRDKE